MKEKTHSEMLKQCKEYFLEELTGELEKLSDAHDQTENCPLCGANQMNVNSDINWWSCGSGTDACGDGCCGHWFYNDCLPLKAGE